MWSNTGSELDVMEGVNISSTTKHSVVFTEMFVIPQLSTADENREYQCEVYIDTKSPVTATDTVILNVTGKHIIIFVMYITFITLP